MKIPPARIEAFVRRPDPRALAVLVYGPDGGLVRERADALVRGVVPDPGDPFRIAEMAAGALRADPARLADEAAAIALTGGRRAVRVREAGDALTQTLAGYLDSPPAAPGDLGLVVVEAGDLGPRSSLRRLFEGADNAAAVPCYTDSQADLRRLVRETLARDRVAVSGEALDFLAESLGGDRMITRSEIAKLAVYAGEGGRIELRDAVACVGDSAALSLDDVAFAAAGGEPAALARALDRAFSEGMAPPVVVRAVARHVERLHLTACRMAAGDSAEAAVAALRPKVFFKRKSAFRAQLRLWPRERAADALDRLIAAEMDCKRTGVPAETVCRQALLELARDAARLHRAA